MTSLEAYFKFLDKINKGNTQGSIACDKGQFIRLFNENQRKYVNQRVPENDVDDVNNVQNIIETATPKKLNSTDEYTAFELPSKWFATSDGYALCSKGSCKKQKVNLRQIKNVNRRYQYFDSNTAPSFEFEWSFFLVETDILKVFKTDFTIDKLVISYYREPKEIAIEGVIRIDNTPTPSNIDPEFNDLTVEQILNETATDFMRNWENQVGFQLNKERVTTQDK